jgi:hypothetical protein
MRLHLIEDITTQPSLLKRWLFSIVMFIFIFFVADYFTGMILLGGLDKYFGLDKPAKILLLGHSHTVLGIDKELLESKTGVRVAKYARQGANLSDRQAMIGQYLNRHPGSVNTIVYDVDAHIFTSSGLSKNSLSLFYPFIDDEVIDSYLAKGDGYWSGNYLLRRIIHSSRYSEVTLLLAMRGYAANWDNLKRGTVDIERLSKQIKNNDFRKIRFSNDQENILNNTLSDIRENGIKVALVYLPTVDVLNNAEPEMYNKTITKLEMISAQDDGITFLNYNSLYASKHELFYDPIHLNPAGQKEITQRLAIDLKRIMDD